MPQPSISQHGTPWFQERASRSANSPIPERHFRTKNLYRSGDLFSSHVAHDRLAIDRTMRDGIGE